MDDFADLIKDRVIKTFDFFSKKDSNLVTYLLAAVLLVTMGISTVLSMKSESATSDEVAHIVAGYSYLTMQDYRLNPEHPPLIKDLAAVPLLFLNLNFPQDSPNWKKSNQWKMGRQFMYESNNDADKILFWARVPMVLVTLLLGLFIFYWTRKLAGNLTALVALIFFSFCPNFLAHGHLVTTDVGAALGAVLTLFFWIKFLKNPAWTNVIIAGLIFGVGLLLKFSLLALIPVLGFTTIVWTYAKTGSFKQVLNYSGRAILAGLIGVIFVVWPVYQIHLLHYPLAKQLEDTGKLFSVNGVGQKGNICLWAASHPVLRPFSHFCSGAALAVSRSYAVHRGWGTYLLGKISPSGFWYYFPVIYLLKIPLAFHLLTLVALIAVLTSLRKKSFNGIIRKSMLFITDHLCEFSMITFVLFYWIVALDSKVDIGLRHLLPVLPFTYILVSLGIKTAFDRIKTPGLKAAASFGALLLLCWYAASSLAAFPYYLTYYNELAGGPKSGYKYAVDSNYDWGQDMRRLSGWVNENNIKKIYVDIFSNEDLDYRLKGKYVRWNGSSWWSHRQASENFPAGNYLAVSATFLQEGRARPVSFEGPQGSEYKWLNNLHPVAQIGNSIFVYYIP